MAKKTREDPIPLSASLGKAYARLRSLSEGTQAYIAEKYYKGKMPWQTGGKPK